MTNQSKEETDNNATIELLSAEELAKALKMSPRTLQKWRSDGRGPRYIRLGHNVRYRSQDIAGWLESKGSRNSAEAADRR